jgi:hypothetical protein
MLKAPSKSHRTALAWLAERSLTRARNTGHYTMQELAQSVRDSLALRSLTQENLGSTHEKTLHS